MLYRIVVDIIYVTLIVTLISDDMFPKAATAKCLVLPSLTAVLKVFPLWIFVPQTVL